MRTNRTSFILNFFVLLVLNQFYIALNTFAAEEDTLLLSLPADFSATVCSIQPWSGKKAKWGGVTDERSDKSVGQQSKSGETILQVQADPELEKVFENSLKQLFASCGIRWVTDEDAPTLQVAITEFFAGSDKKLLTGKGIAESRLRIEISRPNSTLGTLEVGFSIENKGLRKSKLKQLQATLNELLAETLRQIPKLSQINTAL